MRSVPSRGSGWVRRSAFKILEKSHAHHRPTRYRVAVLTSSHIDCGLLRQSPSSAKKQTSILTTVDQKPRITASIMNSLEDLLAKTITELNKPFVERRRPVPKRS